MEYVKPPLTFDQQIELLQSRGLVINDLDRTKNYLSNISYYRLSAYMLPLKKSGEDHFQDNITFDDVLRLYLFDREFRILIFDLIEKLEIAFRTQLIYHPAISGGGAFWYQDPKNFSDPAALADHNRKLDEEVLRATEVFKEHFYNKYTAHSRMPVWMTFEVISFWPLVQDLSQSS